MSVLSNLLKEDSRDLLREGELWDDEIYDDFKEFPTTNIRVLLVDSDPKSLSVTKNLMTQFSYQVTNFENGDEAIAFLMKSKHEIDLVIWDFHVPDINGLEALNAIGKEMDLPVVITSHDHKKETVMKSTKYGACDFLVKPVSKEAIAVLWRHVYHKRRMSKSGLDSVESHPEEDNNDLCQSNEEGSKNVEDSGEQNTSSDQKGDKSSSKKPRMTWTPELHQKFEKAVEKTGTVDKAVPKQILKCMQEEYNVEGLTRNNVASHLQKYRLYAEKKSSVPQETREDYGWRNAGVPNTNLTASKPLLNSSMNLHTYFTNDQAAANAPIQYPTNYLTMNNSHLMNNPPYYMDHSFPQPQQQQQQLQQQPQYYHSSPQITKPESAYVSPAMETSGLVYPPNLPLEYGECFLTDYTNFKPIHR